MTDKPKWDSFTSDVEAGSSQKNAGCTVGAYITSLDKLARIQVEAAMGRKELTTSSIARALRARGCGSSDFTVRRHRRGDCGCLKNGQ